MVGHTFIYTPAVRFAREMIESGELGEIYHIASSRLNLGLVQSDINVAWDLAPHDISIILFILGESPIAVNCQGKGHLGNGMETVTNMTLDFANRTFATIQSSWLDPNKIRKMTIVGSRRMIVYDDCEPFEKIRIYDKRVETPPHYDTFAEFQCSYHYGDMTVPYIRQVEPLRVECQHFMECIRTGEKSDSSAEEGLKVVRVLEASSESLRLGGCRVALFPEIEGGLVAEEVAGGAEDEG
jgi:predicted dehydrogenase